jgi:hypothetical protein
MLLEPRDIRAFDRRIVEVIEVIQHRHAMPRRETLFDEVRPDKPSSAGDKNVHPRTLPAPKICGQVKLPPVKVLTTLEGG